MKAANSYASLFRGVSQQVPQDRADGQHTEQVNLLSDPVNGLCRRHGSVFQAEVTPGLSPVELAAYQTDIKNWRSYPFDTGGKEYVLLYRAGARPVSDNPLPVVIVYNKTDKTYLNLRKVADADLALLETGGISAVTSVGKYLLLAGNQKLVTGASVNRWEATRAQTVVWIRGGAYSRTFKIKGRFANGTVETISYTTPASSYQGTLTTSDIPAAASDYNKQVNDRVNAHNSEVTKYIGEAALAIQPERIALALLNKYKFPGAYVDGSHLILPGVVSVEVSDSGDGSLILGVADEVGNSSQVSLIHYVGKVVKVRARGSDKAYYLKAIAKDPLVTSGPTEVTWSETAGVEHSITSGIYYLTVSDPVAYLASSAAALDTIVTGPAPKFISSDAGDDDSAPQPYFVGRKITLLGAYQSRLLVGSGGVLAVSKVDDYLNFYRSTVLTLPQDDPFEMLPQGSEDDVMRESVQYDQQLVVFGDKRQYAIRGDVALTPTSANLAVMSSYANGAGASPVDAGGFIFYAKAGELAASVHQIQPGQTENSPESFPASSQLDSYLKGRVIEMVVSTGATSTLLLRTTGSPNSLYVFSYLDKIDGRKLDSWSRWDFNTQLGHIMGIDATSSGILVFSLRTGTDGYVYVVADKCPLDTGLSTRPYLDSNRAWGSVTGGRGSLGVTAGSQFAAAFNANSVRRFTGATFPNVPSLLETYPDKPNLVAGAIQEAYFEPTNPYMRDGNGKAIMSGRLTITKLLASFRKTVGMLWTVTYKGQVVSSVNFNGRLIDEPSNLIGIEPITDGQVNIPIGRETRQYNLRISARLWHPFTLTSLEWVGQLFNRVQRF